jgi:hypothetical protein
MRPPRTRAFDRFRRAATGLPKNIAPKAENTRSKPENEVICASPQRSDAVPTPAARASARSSRSPAQVLRARREC